MPGCYRVHEAKMRMPGGGWNLSRHSFGVTPTPPPRQPLAPPDLRTAPLPPQWATMIQLYLQKGNTEYLPDLPPTLQMLRAERNRLRELPAFPASLTDVSVNYNQLTTLPELNAGLRRLNASHNELSTLPAPPATLRFLNLTDNNFTALPSLRATGLAELVVGKNQLTALPELPASLTSLRCDSNQITEIPKLPDGVTALVCSRNPITRLYLENLSNLDVVVANHCQLTEIPVLPEPANPASDNSLQYYFDDNPLRPEFAAIYQAYRTTPKRPGKNAEFRKAIKVAYVKSKQAKLTDMQRLFKTAPYGSTTGQNWYYGPQVSAAQQAMYGNYNPTNLVAQMFSGQKGTIEMQKLALLEQKEALGAAPPGSAARARRRIANIAVSGGPMAERAKLYLQPANIQAAKARQASAAQAAAKPNLLTGLNAAPLPFGPQESNFKGGKRRTHRKRRHTRGTRKH